MAYRQGESPAFNVKILIEDTLKQYGPEAFRGENWERSVSKALYKLLGFSSNIPNLIVVKKTAAELSATIGTAGTFGYATDTGEFVGFDGVTPGGNPLGGGGGEGLTEAVASSVGNVNLAINAPATLDGLTLATGDMVLLKDQSVNTENGPYKFIGTGSPLERHQDFDESLDFDNKGLLFYVSGGLTESNKNAVFSTVNPVGFDLGNDPMTFARTTATFAQVTSYNANNVGDYEGTTPLNVKDALDQNSSTLTDKVKEDTDANLYAELNTRIIRNSLTGELFLVIGDGATSVKYRLNTQLDARTSAIAGATPSQDIHPNVSSQDGSCIIAGVDSAKLVNGDGSGVSDLAIGIGVTPAISENLIDVEYTDAGNITGLGATTKVSLITGDTNAKGANGLPLVQNGQNIDAGANPARLVLDGGGTTAPLGKKYGKKPYVLRNYTGPIANFLLDAQMGEICLSTVDPSITGATLTAAKFYGAVKTSSRIIDTTVSSVAISTSDVQSSHLRFNSTAATDLTVEVAVGDFIQVYTNGDASEQGLHKVRSVAAGAITVETSWHSSTAATSGSMYLAATVERLDGTTI